MTAHNMLLVGTRKGLVAYERSGDDWRITRRAFPGQPVSYAMHDPRSNTLWACLDHGHWGQKLHRSRDWGETWQEIAAPKYPEGAQIKEGTPAALRYLWCMAGGGDDRPERIYIGTEPGGLFRSDDGGDTFEIVTSLWDHPSRMTQWFGGGRDHPGIHSVVVDPRDSSHVFVGISCAGVFETTDDGASWAPANKGLTADFLPDPNVEVGHDPHLLVAAPTDPDKLWQQNHMGIFRSVDGSKSWQACSREGETAHFGFAIAVDETNSETAWVVPATSDGERMSVAGALCVCRTDDGGASWTTLTAGLPQHDSYDIVFRHGLDVSGNTLAFGSTTGNLFISGDRGDSWTTLSNYLAPIYSVRFATK